MSDTGSELLIASAAASIVQHQQAWPTAPTRRTATASATAIDDAGTDATVATVSIAADTDERESHDDARSSSTPSPRASGTRT